MGRINCPGTCSARFVPGSPVVLTATPDEGSDFAGWSGDVEAGHEEDNPLTVTMNGNKTINAVFELATMLGTLRLGSDSGGGIFGGHDLMAFTVTNGEERPDEVQMPIS